MGGSLVARVEGNGIDAFQLISDRLLREHQALPRERWVSIIRSFRQPVPPIEYSSRLSDEQDTINGQTRGKKQRAMYCLRHSGRPGQLIAMIEDSHASSRPAPKKNASKSEPTPPPNAIKVNAGDAREPASSTLDSGGAVDKENIQGVLNEADKPSISESNLPAPSSTLSNQNEFTPMVLDNYEHAAEEPVVLTSSTHYRISLISVPDSFEQLLTSAICASQTTIISSAWCPRPNIVAIEGMTWGIYSSSFDGETGLPTPGPAWPTRSSKEIKPDWYLRLGTVTNKGATTGATSLPWLMLELECAATSSELDPSSRFLESVMASLIQPDEMLRVRPFRPTQQSFVEAGLMTKEDDVFASPNLAKAASLRNGYCLLMLAKQESLI